MVDSAAAQQLPAEQMQAWSIEDCREDDGVAYWRERVRIATAGLFDISVDVELEPFSARASLRRSGPFSFMAAESTVPLPVIRSRRDIANSPQDHFSVYLQLGGRTVSFRGEESIELHAGDIGFCDPRQRQPFRAEYGGRCAIATVPRAMIDQRAPWLRSRPHRKLAAKARFADHVRLHMMELMAGPMGETETSLLADSLCNLVALAAAEDLPPSRLQPELQMEALLAFCRQNLHDPDLSPQHVADHIGISVRTLHARWRQIGQSFGRWLLEQRLQGCSVALRDLRQRPRNISEIAYAWGFNDLSHFNRAFRQRFDMTPGEWRESAQAAE
jgi:AraC family transcriptional regulator, positive regulator of tynA and feaB